MTKIFKQAKDKNVAKVIVYGHTDNFLYSDAAHTTKLNKSELKDLFLKGCLIKTASGDLTPVKYLEAETYTGFVAKTDAASASFYSDGYVPAPVTQWTQVYTASNLNFEVIPEVSTIVNYVDYENPFSAFSSLNTTDDFKVEITDVSKSIEGKFTLEQEGVLLLGDDSFETNDVMGQFNTNLFQVMAQNVAAGNHTVTIYKKVTS